MGWVCAVPGCSSSSSTSTLKNSSGHKFPLKSQELLVKWLKVIPCKSFQPTSNSRVCSIHFYPQDFAQGSRDKRNRIEDIIKQGKQRLNTQAVLSLFPDLQKYLKVGTRNKRSGNATSSVRIKSAEAQFDKKIHEFWAADKADNISTVRNHLLNSKLPGELYCHWCMMCSCWFNSQSLGSVKEHKDMMDKISSKI